MLHVPTRRAFFQVHADLFLNAQARLRTVATARLTLVLSQVKALNGRVLDTGSKAVAVSKQSVLALQIIILFILMPQQYVEQLYYVARFAMEIFKVDVLLTHVGPLDSLHKKLHSSSTKDKVSVPDCEEDVIPDMVKSSSSLSISEMDNHNGSHGRLAVV
jgi:hypothetical protein